MEQQLPTLKQLERSLSQNIHKLYLNELEHSPQKVICKFFGDRLAIAIEGALTVIEQTLINEDSANQIVENLNIAINEVIKSKLKTTIEAELLVEVEEVLFNSAIETKLSGAIVILKQLPQVRSSQSMIKVQKVRRKDEHNYSRADDES